MWGLGLLYDLVIGGHFLDSWGHILVIHDHSWKKEEEEVIYDKF